MGSEGPPAGLPVIDFSKIGPKAGKEEWDSVKFQVRKAWEEYGFFKALYNVPVELPSSVFTELKELFALDLSSTETQNFLNKSFAGYLGKLLNAPFYESMAIDDPLNLESVEGLANVLWPDGKPSFSITIHEFAKHLWELENTIRKMVVESFDLDKYMDEHMNSMVCRVRVMKYEKNQSGDTEVGLTSHKDHNTVTILLQNQVDGLELQTKGGDWIAANMSENSFFVLIGRSFHGWTNGRLHAPNHRVMMNGNDTRYSIGLFSNFRPGYTVKTPQELVDKEHPSLFKPFDYAEYLKFVQANLGKSPTDLTAFCGV